MNVLAQACELGVVTRREIAQGLVSIRPSSTGTDRESVEVRGRVVAYVRGGARPQRLAEERQVLIRFAEFGLVPRLLSADDRLLWTEASVGTSFGARAGRSGERPDLAELTDRCVALGAALAKLHRIPPPASGRPVAPRPTTVGRTLGSPLARLVDHAVRSDRGLQIAVAAVHQRWSERHWIVGRIAPETVQVESAPYLRVRFVDLCEAGLGHADWDVAACLGTIAAVVGNGMASEQSHTSADWLAEHFLHSYRSWGGPGQVHPQTQAAHAVAEAWRLTAEDGNEVAVRAWLDRAHRLAARSASMIMAA